VMSALGPLTGDAPPTQPRPEPEFSSPSESGVSRARKALFGAAG
jgi:hypothetical protein